jgi:hypothetical protein
VKEMIKTEDFVIYDEILDEKNYNNIWLHFQNEKYVYVHNNGWMRVWRSTDGSPMKGPSYELKDFPHTTYVDNVFNIFLEIAKHNNDILGDWNNLSISPYLYPRDTKLNWHDDGRYLGAIIYYVHPYWASTWGGELMLAKTPKVESVPNPCLDHSFEDKFLETYGFGQYITCKPNRIVLTKKGVWHSINRVDKDAGDHCRASYVGFFS